MTETESDYRDYRVAKTAAVYATGTFSKKYKWYQNSAREDGINLSVELLIVQRKLVEISNRQK